MVKEVNTENKNNNNDTEILGDEVEQNNSLNNLSTDSQKMTTEKVGENKSKKSSNSSNKSKKKKDAIKEEKANSKVDDNTTEVTPEHQSGAENTEEDFKPANFDGDFDGDISKPYINNSRPVIELVAALSYIFFFLPFIFCKKEPFALYHANQSLVFWILMVALYLIFGFIPTVNLIALPIIILFNVLGVFYGMYNSATGRARPFFLIGKITLIKWNNV